MQFNETIKLVFENNLIIGNTPDKIGLAGLSEARGKNPELLELESFGLFDSSTANFNTYFPGVTAADLIPKDEDFITPTYRALSEVIVHKEWNPVDFSMNGVLKKSMPLLKGQTVYPDHEATTGNAMGAVMAVEWEESYKAAGGILVPAGINSQLKIDGKSNPKIARGIMMDPPSHHSTSVTVNFMWEKSHAELSQEEFFNKIGTDLNGSLVRRVASLVKKYNEISLVPHGADPYAQLIKDGGIINPKYANVSYNSEREVPGELKSLAKHYFFDFKSDVIKNSIPPETINNNHNSNLKTHPVNKELLIMLAALAGLTLGTTESLTDAEANTLKEKLTAHINKANQDAEALTAAQAEVERLKPMETELTELKAKTPDETALAAKTFMEDATTKLRAEVVENYTKLMEGKPDEAITAMLAKADYASLKALGSQYSVQLESKYPLSCKGCGSTDISRASAVIENKEGKTDAPKTGTEAFQALLDKKRMGGPGASAMHGAIEGAK